jgi:hypothetical protein
VQFVGREIRVLDYIEGVGHEIGYYIAELRLRHRRLGIAAAQVPSKCYSNGARGIPGSAACE